VVAALAQEQLLPAIVFLFSRRGCEQAVFTLHAAGVDLTSLVSTRLLAADFCHLAECQSWFCSLHGCYQGYAK
jgi:superfamily II RNA helicase